MNPLNRQWFYRGFRRRLVKAFGRLARDMKDGEGRPLFKVYKEVYENALRVLFREDETRGKESLAWLRLYDRMEHCLDACDEAAGVVRNVVLKSS